MCHTEDRDLMQQVVTRTQLRELNLSRAGVDDRVPLASMQHLQKLDLSFCRDVRDLAALALPVQLQELRLVGCEALCDLAPLACFTQLQVYRTS